MRAGVTLGQTVDELGAIATRIAHEHPEANSEVQFTAVPLNQRYNGRITDPVWIAFMSVGGLLVLIACSNVANLLLARSVQRSREIAIRFSMGATRFRIVRQLLAEGGLLAALGGLGGFAFSWLALRLFTSLIPENGLPFWVSYTMDGRVFGVLAGASLATVMLFGLAPAVHIARTDVNDLLKQGGRTSSSGARAPLDGGAALRAIRHHDDSPVVGGPDAPSVPGCRTRGGRCRCGTSSDDVVDATGGSIRHAGAAARVVRETPRSSGRCGGRLRVHARDRAAVRRRICQAAAH